MDQEQFYKLPYEKQKKLEVLCFKSVHLGYVAREYDTWATLAVRPMFKSPTGEFRYYDVASDQVSACGKHLYADLVFTCSVSDWGGSYGWDFQYSDVSTIKEIQARAMYNTLKWLNRKMREESEWLFDNHMPSTFAEYITSASYALGAVKGVIWHNDAYKELSLDDLLEHVAEQEQFFIDKYAPKEEEKEDVPEAVSNNPRSEQDG